MTMATENFDVTKDRHLWIGGSDIPAIMGISPFKTRYQLLLEKTGVEENTFEGNEYTEYGNIMEPKIRAYINEQRATNFEPARKKEGDLRGHTDGFNGSCVLEIKTTSQIHDSVDKYKGYLVQLLFYMDMYGVEKGTLAVYNRPKDFNTDFSPAELQIFDIEAETYLDLTMEIKTAVERFRADLERLRANPLLAEQDLQPTELVEVSQKMVIFENRMQAYKKFEAEYKAMKQRLYDAMVNAGVKSWEMPNGTKITRVDEQPATAKTVTEFDLERFKTEHSDLYGEYTKEVIKTTAGRAGYAKITLPKG